MDFLIPILIILTMCLLPLISLIDRCRIKRAVREIGGEVVHIRWLIFKGSDMSEDGLREYAVHYQDLIGRVHHCEARIALLSEVHLDKDILVKFYTGKLVRSLPDPD